MSVERFFADVFKWLFIGLLLTFATAYVTVLYEPLTIFAFKNIWLFVIAQLVLCFVLSLGIRKLDINISKALYMGYALLTGFTFSAIFLAFDMGTIVFVFLATALVFGLFALLGYKTKLKLYNIGGYLLLALLALIILEIISHFVVALDMPACILGVVIFLVYTAYDMQKVKRMAESGNENYAILGAFELYLDFINLFIRILEIVAKSQKRK